MTKANKKKICIVVTSLGKGGAERSSGLLSQMLGNIGYDVHVVSVLNDIHFPYHGELLNLGALKDKKNSVISRVHRLKVFKAYLKEHKFDYVIDNRIRSGVIKELIISKLVYTPKNTIYCIRSFNIDKYINPNRFLGRLIYGNAYKIIGVSKGISQKISTKYRLKNVMTIYNSIKIDEKINLSEDDNNYILFFGRLDDEVKNISLLLKSYSKSKLPNNGIKLKILGDGKDLTKLKLISETLNIASNVEFLGYNPKPFDFVKSALFTVLTSRYEGFPRSILESLAYGTPVISVDCESGPNEIVQNKFNGLLVENHNPIALANAMNVLMEDKDLYLHCKQNAIPSVTYFSEENIVKQWQSVLN